MSADDLPEKCRRVVDECLPVLRRELATTGGVDNTTFMFRGDEVCLLEACSWPTKAEAAAAARAAAAELRPDFIVHVAEAWMVQRGKEQGPIPLSELPIRHHPDRKEVMQVTVETDEGYWHALAPIFVDFTGKRTFGELKFEKPTSASGLYVGLLAELRGRPIPS
jgi:hypothetical protein